MATQVAADATLAAVNTAMGLCNDGDTLVIPAGTETWAGTLTVTKALTIVGAGTASTIITADGATRQLFRFNPGSDKALDLSGICFKDGKGVLISGNKANSYCLDSIRIHGNKFWRNSNGSDSIYFDGWIEGLVDNNTFLNCNRAIMIVGDNNYAWTRTIEAGTEHAIFIEDNTFTQEAGTSGLNECVYHQEGARTVIRYNTFDASAYAEDFVPFDVHGNQSYYDGSGIRGQPIVEVYENTFDYQKSYRVLYFRGGSILCYNNAFTFTGASDEIMLTEEEDWQGAFFSPLRTVWAAEDQIMNSFFWGNTRNGSSAGVHLLNANDSTFIQQNRDYFLHAPESSGGSESYPTRAGADDMAFTAAGANAYYPYTGYIYPHPLQGIAEPYIRMY
jgi:hypothetical protein